MSNTFVDTVEEDIAALTETIVERVRELRVEIGSRPFGWRKGDRWDELDHYIRVRGSEVEWAGYIQKIMQISGLTEDDACIVAMQEATNMERRLEQAGGVEAVQFQVYMRNLRAAERAIEGAVKEESRPTATIVEAEPPEMLPNMLWRDEEMVA